MSAVDAWATTPGGRKVLAEARRRLETGSALARGVLRVELSPAERRDVGGLLGVAWIADGGPPPVAALHKALEARGTNLRELVQRDGPLRDLRAERDAARSAASIELDEALGRLTAVGIPDALGLIALRRRGLPKAGTGQLASLASDIAAVWHHAPGPGAPPVQLAVLASELFDNPHALDRATVLGRTIARLAHYTDLPEGWTGFADVITVAQWRAAWLSLGVICDAVSSVVLTLNLRLTGDSPATALTAIVGEPVWLTLRSVRGDWQPRARDIWVCENPSIVEAAADRLGDRCPPLLCTFGQPSAAALELVRRVHDAGRCLHVRADDDPVGQSIVAQLLAIAPTAQLWRYIQRSSHAAAATPLYEEQILNDLLQDLADRSSS